MASRFNFWITGFLVLLFFFSGADSAQSQTSGRTGETKAPILRPVYPPEFPGTLPAEGLFDDSGEIEIIYLYWYGNPGTLRIEDSVVDTLEAQLPAGTKLIKLPVISDLTFELWQEHGRMALALEFMGLEEKLHSTVIATILPSTIKGQYDSTGRNVPLSTVDKQADFVADLGYNRDDYIASYSSPEVQERFDKIKDYLTKRNVQAAPFFIIQGQYYYYSPNFSRMRSFSDDVIRFVEELKAKIGPAPESAVTAPETPVVPQAENMKPENEPAVDFQAQEPPTPSAPESEIPAAVSPPAEEPVPPQISEPDLQPAVPAPEETQPGQPAPDIDTLPDVPIPEESVPQAQGADPQPAEPQKAPEDILPPAPDAGISPIVPPSFPETPLAPLPDPYIQPNPPIGPEDMNLPDRRMETETAVPPARREYNYTPIH
ncbi:MAG: hypothetical protein LBP22_05330 [Deltaproteobacteria bacterium]|jgi:thiol:disulfide interchange protein DsbA|nr:hypothetical protein [Deltaproteobacteria bacterium]